MNTLERTTETLRRLLTPDGFIDPTVADLVDKNAALVLGNMQRNGYPGSDDRIQLQIRQLRAASVASMG